MRNIKGFEKDGEVITLSDSVEIIAVGLAELVIKKEKSAEEISCECNFLNALSNALLAIKS